MDVEKAQAYKNIFRAREVRHNDTVTKTKEQGMAQQVFLAFGKQKCARLARLIEMEELWDLCQIMVMRQLLDEKSGSRDRDYAEFNVDLLKMLGEINKQLKLHQPIQ
jgi:hypothetical protein